MTCPNCERMREALRDQRARWCNLPSGVDTTADERKAKGGGR